MKKKIFIVIFVMAVAGLIAGVTTGMFDKDNTGERVTLNTAKVTRRDIGLSVIATGIIKPMVGAEVRVGSRISGTVKHLYTNIGDTVRKGRLLARLDPTENEARYHQTLAVLDTAKANLAYTRLDLERKQLLRKQDTVSQDMVDTAQRAFDVAASELEQAKANKQYAKIQLDYTKIYAPIPGVVASVSTQEGETVAAGFAAPTFVTIIDLERLEVRAYVDETDIGRIKEGQRATFTVDTFPDTDFEGTVTAVYPKAEIQNNVVNYLTIIEIMGRKDKILRPEMTTTVNIFPAIREKVPAVPNRAVRRENGEKFVYVLQGRQPEKRKVGTGWKDKYYTEITSGLEENETVVTNPGAWKNN